MVYMDEWEYRLWLQLHKHEFTELLAVEQTVSEEVGIDGVQHAQSKAAEIGLSER